MPGTIDPSSSVAQLVVERPGRSRLFEQMNIDYCCGGKLPLEEACLRRGLDVAAVVNQLNASDADARASHQASQCASQATTLDPSKMTLTDLADHIEDTHHAYLRTELPRIRYLIDRVCKAHGASDPRLASLREAFIGFANELSAHMLKEEHVLFPLVRQIDQGAAAPAGSRTGPGCGSIANPIRQMEAEHDAAGDALAWMRTATDGFTAPANACGTYRAMIDALHELEKDMHQHVHKENNVLFPRALAREAALTC